MGERQGDGGEDGHEEKEGRGGGSEGRWEEGVKEECQGGEREGKARGNLAPWSFLKVVAYGRNLKR